MTDLPETLPGHWSTPEGLAMAKVYAVVGRDRVGKANMSDFELANAVFMAERRDFDLTAFQAAAKERIRWLSVQLALAEVAAAAHRDNWHGLFCTIMNAWPNAEDADSSPQGMAGLIEQLIRERDKAVEALREVVTARPGWREAARIALAAVDEPA